MPVSPLRREGATPKQTTISRPGATTFKSSTGIAVAERLLLSDDPEDRLRGIERLGSIGTPEAIDALLEAMEQGTAVGRDPRARLLAVRVLAPHVKRDTVRQLIGRELQDASGAEGRGASSPLSGLTRGTAALALARSGEKKALGALVTALLQGGTSGDAAGRALRAHPPASLQPFVEGKKRLVPQLATFLGELGDLRAIERLRAMLNEPDPGGRAAAGVALAKLGDETALVHARAWIKRADPRLMRAAAEMLARLHAPDAPQAMATLLSSDALRSFGVRLALEMPSPALAKALASVLPALPEEDRPRAVAAIGRGGGAEAVRQLKALLGRPEHATDAAFALAKMPEEGARAALEAAIAGGAGNTAGGDPKAAARIFVRAGILRALALGDGPSGLVEKLEALMASKDGAERAVAAFGLVALGARDTEDLIEDLCPAAAAAPTPTPTPTPKTPGESAWKRAADTNLNTNTNPKNTTKGAAAQVGGQAACDHPVMRAAARGSLARGPEASAPFMALLASPAILGHEPEAARSGAVLGGPQPEETAVAAGVALLAMPDGGPISTSLLAAWAEQGGPLSPLAARALPSRDDEVLRGAIKRLLAGSDPAVRAHVAHGRARDPEADAVSLLTRAYRFEEDASVRRAIVRALSRRKETQRQKTLIWARDLDPDEAVRALARAALAGRVLDEPRSQPRGELVWVSLTPNDPKAAPMAAGRTARLVRSDGLAVPVVADPDGVLLVPGLPPGESSLLLGKAAEPAR
jgi:HEAT repeat protein